MAAHCPIRHVLRQSKKAACRNAGHFIGSFDMASAEDIIIQRLVQAQDVRSKLDRAMIALRMINKHLTPGLLGAREHEIARKTFNHIYVELTGEEGAA
jgi:hypothetical protein